MARSLGLAAYRALAGRTSSPRFSPSMARPKGDVVWIHAPEPGSILAISDLSERLKSARYNLSVLITLPDESTLETARDSGAETRNTFLESVPSEHPEAIESFWRHWQPNLCVWAWGQLRPNLILRSHTEKCPVILIDADVEGFEGRRERWLPDLSRRLLEPCAALMVRSSSALKLLQDLGLSNKRVDLTPALEAGGKVLSCDDTDLADLASLLRGRPVWMANSVYPDELPAVLAAHRSAMQLSHRLLLILIPAKAGFDKQFRDAVEDEAFRIADWSDGEEPDDATQVLLATDSHDLGLFFRIAPVTFMGGTLGSGRVGRNPFEAAALGSAVLYGPNAQQFAPFYDRLTKAGAARIIEDTESLAAAVTRLIAPDQAAAMAHAGWDVVSQGAALTDRVIDLVQAGLDGDLEGANARP